MKLVDTICDYIISVLDYLLVTLAKALCILLIWNLLLRDTFSLEVISIWEAIGLQLLISCLTPISIISIKAEQEEEEVLQEND